MRALLVDLTVPCGSRVGDTTAICRSDDVVVFVAAAIGVAGVDVDANAVVSW